MSDAKVSFYPIGVPPSRTLTINGTAFDLSANRSWSVGTVTSVAAITLGTSGTDLSSTVATGTTTPVITLNVPTASATNRGALSSADWTTFNNKIGGSGTNGQIAYFTASGTLASNSALQFSPTTVLRLQNTITAGLGLAQSSWFRPSLTAAANNDVLVVLDIQPSFSNGAFTGVSNFALRTQTGNVVLGTTSGSVGIGTSSINASAILDVTSTARGFLAPRMTTAQKNAIATPATGLLVYDTTLNAFNFYNGSVWGGFGGGGLTNWTEAFASGTQATSSFTATNAAANVNAAITPKGTGAVVAQTPDGTTTGGNARGQYAVDWQMSRGAANQVASGNYATILGGGSNRASGDGSVAGGGSCSATNTNSVAIGSSSNAAGPYSTCFGLQNNSNSWYSVVGGGFVNTANAGGDGTAVLSGGFNNAGGSWSCIAGGSANGVGSFCFIGGGQSNTAIGSHSVVTGGQSNTANAQWATISGGTQNQATGNYAVSVGGFQNLATALNSTIGGGDRNTASGQNSVIPGGGDHIASGTYSTISGGWASRATAQYSTVKGGALASASLYGQQVFAAGRFGGAGIFGDAQAHELIWRREITGTAITELFLDGASIAAILPGTNAIWQGTIDIAAVCTVTGNGTTTVGDVEATSYKVTIKRIGTTTSLVGTVQEIGTTNADASMATGVFTIDNNDTSESLRIQFTPPTTAGSTTVTRAVATFRGLQIQY